MKTSFKVISLVAILAAGFGLTTLTSGCAATPTKESTGQYVDDSSITAKVKASFVKDPVVNATDVTVETFKGIVQLSGFVNTSEQKAQAGRLAAAVPGVVDVKNSIVVK